MCRTVITVSLEEHIFFSLLGERDGQLILVFLLSQGSTVTCLRFSMQNSYHPSTTCSGKDCIKNTLVIDITTAIRYFHNYLASVQHVQRVS